MDVPPIAPAIVDAVAHVLSLSSAIDPGSNDGDLLELACDVLEAAAPLLIAAERERIRQLAQEYAFRLYRPGNGPGAGQQAMDVVPLAALVDAVIPQDGAR